MRPPNAKIAGSSVMQPALCVNYFKGREAKALAKLCAGIECWGAIGDYSGSHDKYIQME